MDTQEVTATQNEVAEAQQTQEAEKQTAPEEATGGEASEQKEGEAKPETAKPEVATATHNRENAESRTKLTKRNRELELENARLRGFTEGLQQSGAKPDSLQPADLETLYAKQNPEPDPTKYDTNAAYIKDMVKWEKGKDKFLDEHTAKRTQATEQGRQYAEKVQGLRSRGEEKYEDFPEVVGAASFSDPVSSAILESERSEDLAYYLASNPAEKTRIEKLSPFLQAKEVGRIEAGLESGRLQIKQTTSAPPPPATVSGKSGPKEDPLRTKNDEEFYKIRAQQRAEKRKGRV